jgi:3-hydroxyacyl-CoA dehydrogenase
MAVSIRRESDLAIVTVNNPPVNALSQAVRQGLFDAAVTLDDDPSVSGVILICAGRTFIAGADVNEFGKPPLEPHLPNVVDAIEAAKKPWIAAIHGTALGGGFEVAMGCRFRVALKEAKIGLPEVTLGIVPGAGGTVRTPRLAGIDNAVELVTKGKPVTAARALAMGLIDAVVEGDLLSSAALFARTAFTKELPLSVRARPVQAPTEEYWAAIEQTVRKAARGEDAPLHALASIRNSCTADFDSALAFERKTFLELRASPQAAALRAVFFTERAALRPPELAGIEPRRIDNVAVVGGSKMGTGIVVALRDGGFPVVLVERDQATLDRSLADVMTIFDKAVQSGHLTRDLSAARMAGIVGSTNYDALKNSDFVIESLSEEFDSKRSAFAHLAGVCRPDTILATTAHFLDPRMIAKDCPHPERFIGLHFFNPARVTKLLEIIQLPETSPYALATAFAFARMLNAIPVLAGIGEGYIGERLLKIMHRQAALMVSAGESPTAVDRAMRDLGFAISPFEARNRDDLNIEAPQRKATHENSDSKGANVAQRVIDRTDIVHAIIFSLIDEGSKMLAEGIAKRATDIDLVAIHACGFPRRLGGPMHFALAYGLKAVVTELDRMYAEGLAAAPCDMLRRAAMDRVWQLR